MRIKSSGAMQRYNHLMNEISEEYHRIASVLGLSDSAMIILYMICENGDSCLLRDIYHSNGISKQTVNSAIRKLEEERIIYLEAAGPKNKRVCLTEAGKRLAERTAARVIRAENNIFSSWKEEDVEKYLALTERFLKHLREETRGWEGTV